MSSNWFYSSNGQQHGPISEAQLKQLADSGQLRSDDVVCQEGSEQWVTASKVKGLFTAPQAQAAASLPQIDVGKAVKGLADSVQGVVQSEPVQSAAASIKNAAGQAAEGVGTFVRSDAVQSQVKSANSFWSNLTTQNKLMATGIGGLGLLMMSCCVCGGLGMMIGTSNPSSKNPVTARNDHSKSSTEESPYSNVTAVESTSSIENRQRIEEKLKGLTHIDLQAKYSDPTQILVTQDKPNSKYYVWKIGSKETKLYVVQWVVFRLDGSGRSIDADAFVVTSEGLARMTRKLNLVTE